MTDKQYEQVTQFIVDKLVTTRPEVFSESAATMMTDSLISPPTSGVPESEEELRAYMRYAELEIEAKKIPFPLSTWRLKSAS